MIEEGEMIDHSEFIALLMMTWVLVVSACRIMHCTTGRMPATYCPPGSGRWRVPTISVGSRIGGSAARANAVTNVIAWKGGAGHGPQIDTA
jgi:hypothetical protein